MNFRALIGLLLCLTLATPLWAQMSPELETLRTEWARIKYQLPKAERKEAFEQLSERAAKLTTAHPGEAEPLIWEGIIVASAAGEQGGIGLSALNMVMKAKDLLDQAEQIDPKALDGSVYTSLGSLYYQVPGWPVAFGDKERARDYLQKALQLNPDGIDPNYFYGDYLMKQKDFAGAIKAFERALAAPSQPDRPIFDSGRREEIRVALTEARKMQQ